MNSLKNKFVSEIDFTSKGKVVSYLNLYNYLVLRKNIPLLKEIDCFTFDGFFLQKLFLLFYGLRCKRLAPDFGSYFKELFDFLNVKKQSVFLVGATDMELERFCNVILQKYPFIKIVGKQNGYFKNDEESLIFKNIKTVAPNKIIVGLGSPKQEEFSVKIRKEYPEALVFNCGAFISQTANKGFNYYPKHMNKLNLRWVYRLVNEPKLFKRYSFYYPKSVCFFVLDFIKYGQKNT